MKILWDKYNIEQALDRLNLIQGPLRSEIINVSILSLARNNSNDDFNLDCHGSVASILGLSKSDYIAAIDELRLLGFENKQESKIGDIYYFHADEMVSHSAIIIAKEQGIDILWSKLGIENGIGIGSADETFTNYVRERKNNIICREYIFPVDEIMKSVNKNNLLL
jgi:hypothetical protein